MPRQGGAGEGAPAGGGGTLRKRGRGAPWRATGANAARGNAQPGEGGAGAGGGGAGGTPRPPGPAPEPAKAARKSTPKLARQYCAVWVCRVSRPAAFRGLPYFPLVGLCSVGFWWISFGNSTAVLPYRHFPI